MKINEKLDTGTIHVEERSRQCRRHADVNSHQNDALKPHNIDKKNIPCNFCEALRFENEKLDTMKSLPKKS